MINNSRIKLIICIVSILTFNITGCGNNKETEKEVISINVAGQDNAENMEDNRTEISSDTENISENAAYSVSDNSEAVAEEYASYDFKGYSQFKNLSLTKPGSFTSEAVIYYQPNPDYFKTVPADISFGNIECDMADGGKLYKIPVTIKIQELYTADNIKYSGCITPSVELADDITGEIIPLRDTKGNDKYDNEVIINSEDKEYKISYNISVSITTGDYALSGNGDYTRLVSFNAMYEVLVPEDYSGLIFKISPVTEYKKVNISELSLDKILMDQELSEGTVFVKISE